VPTLLNASDPLECYGHNLTTLAQQGAFAPLADQKAVVSRIFQILQRKSKCNPILLYPDANRRWAVVAELVRRMAVGDVPDPFSHHQVFSLDFEALFANLADTDNLLRQKRIEQQLLSWLEQLNQPEYESDEEWLSRVDRIPLWPKLEEWIAPTMALERLQSIFIAMRQSPDTILLFVDPFHRLVGGEYERYPIDAFNLLKPALCRHEVQLIAGCTLEQYRQHVERNATLQRCFQEVCLPDVQNNL
jgi:ATP-dependent Clp protease ATP-binding subunit ClpA